MNVRTFIDRPILSGVISVLMVLVGIIGLTRLALEQFPEIAPPTVRIMASYTGANAETVQKSVIVPLEEAINGVEGMMYMTSSASNNGTASIGIFFRQGTDPNMAMVNVQNRAATVQGRLPSDVVKSGLTVRKRQTSNIKQIAVYSPDSTFDRSFLANYTKINIEPRLSRIPGVGEVNVMGADYSMRIWLDPLKMARYGLTPADVTNVLNEQNVEVATGTLGAESQNTFQYVLKYRGRYEEEQEYENLVIRSLPDGDVLRIGDIARVELGSQNYNIIGETNGSPGINISINQVAGSNANEIIKQIDAEVEDIRQSCRGGGHSPIVTSRHRDRRPGVEEGLPRRLHRLGSGNALRGPLAGHPRGVAVPGKLACHHHPRHRHRGVADSHAGRYLCHRLLAQHADALCIGSRHRYGGGRRHRGGRGGAGAIGEW